MKVLTPTRLLADAAEVLSPFRDSVVIVGAAALEVALADATSVAITPTRDIDVVVPVNRVADIAQRRQMSGAPPPASSNDWTPRPIHARDLPAADQQRHLKSARRHHAS